MELTEGMMTTKGELSEICAIKATNRKALIDYTNAYIESDFFTKHPDASYLHVELQDAQSETNKCGSADYKTEADVPDHSVPCPCGNSKHWLIKYDEESI